MITYVALLRGINVGCKNTVSMAELKICCEKLGFHDIKTYINSGNLIFESSISSAREIETILETDLAKHFGFEIRVIVKSLSEMSNIVNNLPPSWSDSSDKKCNVIFLHHSIDNADILNSLQPKPGIEEVHYIPGVLFWSAQTSSLTKSNMIKLSSMPIYKFMTVRILNTVIRINDIMCTLSH